MSKHGVQHSTMSNKIRIALCQHQQAHPHLTQKELVQWLKNTHNLTVSQGTISNTLKRSTELLSKTNDQNLGAKRQRTVKYPQMESALFEWFTANQERVNMSGDLIKEHAEIILNRLYPDHEPFEFSNGWLETFKVRHGICSFRRFGESGSVDMAAIANALPSIRDSLDMYEWKDIYNMDETGLFYRMQADNSLATKQLEGRKQSKERITVVVCCNGDGTDKLPLWIIGKYKNPRCFKNINQVNLGCQYRNNSKAWMTQILFLEWLKAFDLHMVGRNVLLIMDNCSAHMSLATLGSTINLRNTKVLYLPPNTTSKIQPCDAGIIRNFKGYYRRRFNRLLLQRLEDNVTDAEKISILEAIEMAAQAWRSDVKCESIQNCFLHCKIRSDTNAAPGGGDPDLVDHSLIQDLESQIQRIGYRNPMSIDNFMNYPEEEMVACTPDIQDIIEKYIEAQNTEEWDQTSNDDDSAEHPHISVTDAYNMVHSLETFWLQQDGDCQEFVVAVQKMKDRMNIIKTQQMQQKNILDYFHCV
jgi:hypothetical protein